MKTSYNKEDVTLLLKDLTGEVEPVSLEERDKRVKNGEYVRSILIKEYEVSKEYRDIVNRYIPEFAKQTAILVKSLSEKLYNAKGKDIVLVDIVRAGIPIGILVKRYFKVKYGVDIPHYGISLVKGLDKEAMNFIIEKHGAENIQFIDGWTGKGTVTKEIAESCKEFKGVDDSLAVLSDAIGVAKYVGTTEDVYIPNSPLNASITGLVSITILNEKYKGKDDFHGAAYLKELEEIDQSKEFVDLVSSYFEEIKEDRLDRYNRVKSELFADDTEIDKLSKKLDRNKKLLNPGINEAARAVLRRKLEKLIVSDKSDIDTQPLIELAISKGVEVIEMSLNGYKAVSVANDDYVR